MCSKESANSAYSSTKEAACDRARLSLHTTLSTTTARPLQDSYFHTNSAVGLNVCAVNEPRPRTPPNVGSITRRGMDALKGLFGKKQAAVVDAPTGASRWHDVAGAYFGEMTPFMAGVYSSAVAAAAVFMFRVTRVLVTRMKRRMQLLEARRAAAAVARANRQPPPPRTGSTKKRK